MVRVTVKVSDSESDIDNESNSESDSERDSNSESESDSDNESESDSESELPHYSFNSNQEHSLLHYTLSHALITNVQGGGQHRTCKEHESTLSENQSS